MRRLIHEVTVPFREYLLNNPRFLLDLLNTATTTGEESGGLANVRNDPQLLLALFGITPGEFLEALQRIERPPPRPDAVSEFLEEITRDDLLALERVVRAGVPLDVALPIFLEQNRDADATIEEANRQTESGGRSH
jgi:hypothetical protein